MPRVCSDHNPILLEHCAAFRGPSPFKFEEMWFQVLNFFDVVNLEWNRMCFDGNPSRIFVLKLKGLKVFFKSWNKDSGLSLKADMERITKSIVELDRLEEERNLYREDRVERERLRKELQVVVCKEESFWRQRSRINWLKEGDRNTNFFHKVASQRRNSNDIYGLLIDDMWTQDPTQIRSHCELFYTSFFRKAILFDPSLLNWSSGAFLRVTEVC